MARKRSRRKQQASTGFTDGRSSTAVATEEATAITTKPAKGADTAVASPTTAARLADGGAGSLPTVTAVGGDEPAPKKKNVKAPKSALVVFLNRLAKVLGSLQLAVTLLSLFTMIVFMGNLTEHYYNTDIVQSLIYNAWWFNFLLFMLVINVFFAAAKKMRFDKGPLVIPPVSSNTFLGKTNDRMEQGWSVYDRVSPWKRHQIGFVITHIGLITMLFGGLINAFLGVDAYVQVIDTSDPEVRAEAMQFYGALDQSSHKCYYSHVSEIRLSKSTPQEGTVTEKYDFSPGALPWTQRPKDPNAQAGPFLSILNWLQQPTGRFWSLSLDRKTWVEVVDFIPHAQKESFVRAKKGAPAFKIQLNSAKFPFPVEEWLSPAIEHRVVNRGPIIVEIVSQKCPMDLVRHGFFKPPQNADLGKRGILSIVHRGQPYHVNVDERLGRKTKLGDGLEIKILKFLPNWPRPEADGPPAQPGIEFELYENGRKRGEFTVLARINELVFDLQHRAAKKQGEMSLPLFWYHSPDVRAGRKGVKGVLQFVLGQNGQIYYRTYAERKDGFVLEKTGVADVKNRKEHPIWGRMKWSFRIVQYFDHAEAQLNYTPANILPGKATEMDRRRYPKVIKCRLHTPEEQGKPREFWLEETAGKRFKLGKDLEYVVQYTYKSLPLGFEIQLDRAVTTHDPGTQRAASYSSWVRIFDADRGVNGRREYITMNEPLEYRGFTFYQSDLRDLKMKDVKGKMVNLSGFTVARDPGLWIKYIGSIFLGLGIFTMFYMRAYFFKPRRRKPRPESAS